MARAMTQDAVEVWDIPQSGVGGAHSLLSVHVHLRME